MNSRHPIALAFVLGAAAWPASASAQVWVLPPGDGFESYEQPALAFSSAEDQFLVPIAGDKLILRWFDPDQPADGSPSWYPEGFDEHNWNAVPPETGTRGWPAIAYDSSSNLALLVYERTSQGKREIRGAFCDGGGRCTSSPFAISAGGDDRQPRVAFSAATQRYLVVWQRTITDMGALWPVDEVVGRFVSASGALIGRELVLNTGYQARTPAVAYSPDDQYFLVVWEDQATLVPYAPDIAGCWVRADGTFKGSPFAIADNTGEQLLPRVAYDPDHGQYLIVWEDRRWGIDIFARRMDYSGAFLGSSFPVAWVGSKARTAPDVSYEPGTHTFQVAYELASSPSNRDIRSRTVDWSGQLGRVVDHHSSAGFDECGPAIASRPYQSLVVWQSCDYIGVPMNTVFGRLF